MQPFVSVIVIAYNAAGTIARCIDSILGQSLNNIELIVIDDGSTDGTSDVLDRYMDTDHRISIFHQQNSGVAAARQKGLDQVSGSFFIYVDSDDWIEPDMLEALYGKAIEESADMVFCDYVEENGLGTFYRKQEPLSTDSKVVLGQMMVDLHGSLWTKLVSVQLYRDSGIRFVERLNYCEDECFVLRLLSYGCRVAYVNRAFYHYDKLANANSISNLWAYRPVDEYELFLSSCEPCMTSPRLRKNLDERTAAIIKKLTYAPRDKYAACKAFYHRHKAALMRSSMSTPKKLLCILYFNGFHHVVRWRKFFQGKH